MATFDLNNYEMVFFDQFRTLAFYEKATKKFTAFILKSTTTSTSYCYTLSVTGTVLTIALATSPPPVDDLGWNSYLFNVPNEAGYVWMEGSFIVIGMGDVRGVAAYVHKFQLVGADSIVHITSLEAHKLRIHQ